MKQAVESLPWEHYPNAWQENSSLLVSMLPILSLTELLVHPGKKILDESYPIFMDQIKTPNYSKIMWF